MLSSLSSSSPLLLILLPLSLNIVYFFSFYFLDPGCYHILYRNVRFVDCYLSADVVVNIVAIVVVVVDAVVVLMLILSM